MKSAGIGEDEVVCKSALTLLRETVYNAGPAVVVG